MQHTHQQEEYDSGHKEAVAKKLKLAEADQSGMQSLDSLASAAELDISNDQSYATSQNQLADQSGENLAQFDLSEPVFGQQTMLAEAISTETYDLVAQQATDQSMTAEPIDQGESETPAEADAMQQTGEVVQNGEDAKLEESGIAQSENTEPLATQDNNQSISESQNGSSSDQAMNPALHALQMNWCKTTLRTLKRHHEASPFLVPVDPIALGIPNYPDIIKHPMDLQTVEKKLQAQQYKSAEEFKSDIRLILDNCFTFNPPEHQIHKMGLNVEKSYNTSLKRFPTSLEAQDSLKAKKEAYDEDRRKSFRRSDDTKLMHSMHKELTKLQHRAFMFPFYAPVDPVALQIPTYFDVIKEPMDLQTMKTKLDKGLYNAFEDFEADFRLMISNCHTFNRPEDGVYVMGQQAQELFDQQLRYRNKSQQRESFGSASKSAMQKLGKRKSTAYDDSDQSSSEEEDNIQIKMIENQIMFLQSQLATLRKTKKNQKKKRRGSKTSPLMDMGMMMGAPQQSKPPRVPKVPRAKKPKKEVEVRKITFEEKRQLSDEINNLEGAKLDAVVQIIHEGMPQLANADGQEEIELDIEQLDDHTLTRLWNAVKGKKRRPKAVTSTDAATAANRIKELGEQLALMEGRVDKSGKSQMQQSAHQSSSEDSDSGAEDSDLE